MYENVDIRLLDDCRVTRYFVHEYDSVRVGDTLFEYIDDNDDSQNSSQNNSGGGVNVEVNANRGGDYSWIQREIFNKQEKNSSSLAKKKENASLIKSYEAELERIRASVVLGVLPQSRLDVRQNEIVQLKAENSRIDEEIAGTRRIISQLQAEMAASRSVSQTVTNNSNESSTINSPGGTIGAEAGQKKKYFISPISGSINRIYTLEYETALRDEVVLAIHKKSPIFVRAYFDQEDLADVAIGEEFTVTFPDGTVSRGILKSFYYSTIPLPEEFQKKYEPVSRAVVGDIYPVNADESQQWKNFYKMSVDVSKYKY
jgi:multidrug efflux pump subunit AcrA (membrane-fusion protein)